MRNLYFVSDDGLGYPKTSGEASAILFEKGVGIHLTYKWVQQDLENGGTRNKYEFQVTKIEKMPRPLHLQTLAFEKESVLLAMLYHDIIGFDSRDISVTKSFALEWEVISKRVAEHATPST